MTFRLGAAVESVAKDASGRVVTALAGGRAVRTEMLLYCAGRMGATFDLGLEQAGLTTDGRGRLTVDAGTF